MKTLAKAATALLPVNYLIATAHVRGKDQDIGILILLDSPRYFPTGFWLFSFAETCKFHTPEHKIVRSDNIQHAAREVFTSHSRTRELKQTPLQRFAFFSFDCKILLESLFLSKKKKKKKSKSKTFLSERTPVTFPGGRLTSDLMFHSHPYPFGFSVKSTLIKLCNNPLSRDLREYWDLDLEGA